ncbi:MAG: class I adenylate-forming enzyme family protein [Ferruginibacter sp.]
MSLHLLTIQHWLRKHATYRPQHPAIIFEEKRLTYQQLYEEVNRLSNAFIAAGIHKGDKIATLLSNSLELWETYWACAAIGAVAVPLSPLLRGDGLFNLLDNSDTKLVITSQNLTEHVDVVRKKLKNIPAQNFWVTDTIEDGYANYHAKKNDQSYEPPEGMEVTGDDPYNIIYSSGTTGLPKGIVISHAVRALYGSLFANAYRMTPESVVMHSGSIIFNGSFLTLMPAMFLGCTYVLMSHYDAKEVVDIIRKENVTHTILVPSQVIGCLQRPDFNKNHLPSLEYILSVGAPLLLEQKQELNKRITGVFYELYGLTEGFMTILDKNDAMKKTGSVGTAPQFMDLKIVDDAGKELPQGIIGEIIGRGPLLMTGYYKNPEQTNEAIKNGWLFTGDMGYVDKDDFLFLTGRKKDLIISGGVNVYPTDIEEIVIRHPAVKDVAVFGVPHNEWGETPMAAVVLKDGITATPVEIKCWANQHLEARYQKIYQVIIMAELPRNVAGKVLKRELREQFANLKI